MTAAFFDRSRRARPGLALFLNAGDPSFEELRRVVVMLDRAGVDCLELAVPFPNAVTDGAVIRRSAARALSNGADLTSTLAFVKSLRGELSRLKIVLMADWRHTVRALSMGEFLGRVRRAGCDGLLLHGIPPRARPVYYEHAAGLGQPIVTTCYVTSSAEVFADAAAHASAYVYLVSHYGRGEGAARPDGSRLAPAVEALRELSRVPIAVGFGVRTGADARAVWRAGADAAIVGGACVACLEQAIVSGRDPVEDMRLFLVRLRGEGGI
jgi:tryptophan synthase alpha chain